MSIANERQVEKLIFAIGGFLKKLEPFKNAADKVYAPLEQSIKRYEDAQKGQLIVSDNDTVNKLWALAKLWKHQLNAFHTKDENYWMEKSGVNLFVRESVRSAITKLNEIKEELKQSRLASDACIDLIYVLNVSDHMDVKGWASMLVSTKALDIEARRDAVQEFRDCMDMTDRISAVVTRCLATLQNYFK